MASPKPGTHRVEVSFSPQANFDQVTTVITSMRNTFFLDLRGWDGDAEIEHSALSAHNPVLTFTLRFLTKSPMKQAAAVRAFENAARLLVRNSLVQAWMKQKNGCTVRSVDLVDGGRYTKVGGR